MEKPVVLLCKRGGKSAGVLLSQDLTYDGLIAKLCAKFSELVEGSFTISYAFDSHPSCLIDCDGDLDVLRSLPLSSSVGHIDVLVNHLGSSTSGCKVVDVVTGSCTSGVDVVSCVEDVSSISVVGEVDMLSSFCRHEEKILKSARWVNSLKEVGQEFAGGALEFRDCLIQFSLYHGFKYIYQKNDSTRVVAVCSERWKLGCKWMVKARLEKSNGSFIVKEFVNLHTCGSGVLSSSSSRASSDVVGRLMTDAFRLTPSKRPLDFLHEMKDEYGVEITYKRAWMAMNKAKGSVFGDFTKSFTELRWFLDAFKASNPESFVVMDSDGSCRFVRLFVGFDACRHGFKFCRPIICVDATFLKGTHKGCLLAACAKDANQGLYPLCVAVVDAENLENWVWFMENLKIFLGLDSDDRDVVFFSDRNSGLIHAVRTVFPGSAHSFCLVHLKANLRKHLGGVETKLKKHLISVFHRAAYAPTVVAFNKLIQELKGGGGVKVVDFLRDLPKNNWCHAHFPGKRYGELTTNLVESFNSWIKEERSLPITKLVDRIRLKLMEQMSNRRDAALKWNCSICPTMDKKLANFFLQSRTWGVSKSNDELFEVLCHPSVSVDIGARTCSCCEWQINCFPCVHAVCALKKSGKNMYDYVDKYYHVVNYLEAYSKCIKPVPTLSNAVFVPTTNDMLLPPICKRPPGRPRVERISSMGARTRKVTCGRCGKVGHHNKATCKEPLRQ